MYSIIDRHIGKTLITTTSLVLLVLVGLSTMIKYVEQLKKVGRGTYDLLDAAFYVLYSTPRDLEVFFPVCALLGGLVGLGMLASHSELVVMQAAGKSKLEIVLSVMKTAIPIAFLVMAMGEWVVPVAERQAKELKAMAISGGSILAGKRGTWAKDGDDFVFIGSVQNAEHLNQITVYKFDEQKRLVHVAYYQDAFYQAEGYWQVKGVDNTFLSEEHIRSLHKNSGEWRSTLTPDKLSVVSVKPEALPISGLKSYVDYLKAGKQDASRYELALWRKILQPLAIATMMLLALSFIFGPLRSMAMGARIVLGVIAGFSFHMADQLFGPMSIVFNLPAWAAAALPSILFFGFAVYLLRRA